MIFVANSESPQIASNQALQSDTMSSPFERCTEVSMSQDEEAYYVPTQRYSAGLQYPPGSTFNTWIRPCKEMIEDAIPTVGPANYKYAEGDFICPGFFSRASVEVPLCQIEHSDWTFEMRRQAQRILPFLSLGPSLVLRDREFLRSEGFTLLLAIRSRQSAMVHLVSGEKAAAELGIQADSIDVRDNQELAAEFPRAIRRINDHLAGVDVDPTTTAGLNANNPATQNARITQKKKVLVFCETGSERSAAVVIAYLMVMLNMQVFEAAYLIQQYRCSLSIDEPVKRVLAAFDTVLAAKRDVEQAKRAAVHTGATTLAPPPVSPVVLSKKRTLQTRRDDGADTIDGMALDEEDMASIQEPCAPFQDRMLRSDDH